jgi:hypothetical protein
MLKRLLRMARMLAFRSQGLAPAQSPPSEQMAAARELVVTMKLAS